LIESVKKMIAEHKDEPYLLLWVLGNENNLPYAHTNAVQYPDDYTKFLNRVAKMVHALDPHHPVAFVSGDLTILSFYQRNLTDVDIVGINAYRGPHGFGNLWNQVKTAMDKPVLITEYGGGAAAEANKNAEDEDGQALFQKNAWLDIVRNRAGGPGEGNAIGGMVYDWLDKWWQDADPRTQSVRRFKEFGDGNDWGPEYTGICSQGDGTHSPFLRQLRKIYFIYKNELWNK
jgi:beta-glucuronidase